MMSWVIEIKYNYESYIIRSKGCSNWQLLYHEYLMRVLYIHGGECSNSLFRGFTSLWMDGPGLEETSLGGVGIRVNYVSILPLCSGSAWLRLR